MEGKFLSALLLNLGKLLSERLEWRKVYFVENFLYAVLKYVLNLF